MLGNAGWAEMVYLLFKGEAPSRAQASALDILAVALANPGPRDAAVHAAMCAGVSGNPAAAALMAALAVGAGGAGGAREVYRAMQVWATSGKDLDAWKSSLREQTLRRPDPTDAWPAAEHPAGFEPLGVDTPTPVIQVLARLAVLDAASRCAWLEGNLAAIERAAGSPAGARRRGGRRLRRSGHAPGRRRDAVPVAAAARRGGPRSRAARRRGTSDSLSMSSSSRSRPRESQAMIDARTGPELLRENVGRLRSRVGGCFMGSHAMFRGKDLHAELADASWLDLYLFGITGRRFSKPQLRLLEAMWAYTSYPDARIWNNRIAALAGSARSTGQSSVLGRAGRFGGAHLRSRHRHACQRVLDSAPAPKWRPARELGPLVRRELRSDAAWPATVGPSRTTETSAWTRP